MTVYNINLGIGWASSGVEYAQAYRSTIFQQSNIPAKFVFTDLITQDNISDLTRNMGFVDEDIIWLYTYFTDIKTSPTTYTLDDVRNAYAGTMTDCERLGNVIKLQYEGNTYLSVYLADKEKETVRAVEYVSNGNLIRKDFYSYTKVFSEYYAPKDNRAELYLRRFFNEDGSRAYDELLSEGTSIFQFPDRLLYSKEELVTYFMKSLNLTTEDVVILDRSTGVGQSVFEYAKPAALGVVIHAEHFSENATTDAAILWNNFYDYQFTHHKAVDFYITATKKQKEILEAQFDKYMGVVPKVVDIPVGSLSQLRYQEKRRPYSMITASRLAVEKHVDWLAKAVVEAHKIIPELTFDIYGHGGEETKIREIIEKYNAQDYIRLLGHKDLTDIYQHYQLYLTASKSEGFGLTLLEAVGAGLPLIGFDTRYGNQTFICHGENGYLIPMEVVDREGEIVERFCQRIIEVFQKANLEAFHEHSYTIAEQFLDKVVQQKWVDLIEEVTHD
ncbi:accessory Sec system glycosyltransferase GtfA [Streptococcus suis]